MLFTKLLATALLCGILSGCYPKGETSPARDGASAPMPKSDLPNSRAPLSPPVGLDPAPATRPASDGEVVDMSLG
jgi:hypothetical protein